jgi:hypothetical protein
MPGGIPDLAAWSAALRSFAESGEQVFEKLATTIFVPRRRRADKVVASSPTSPATPLPRRSGKIIKGAALRKDQALLPTVVRLLFVTEVASLSGADMAGVHPFANDGAREGLMLILLNMI